MSNNRIDNARRMARADLEKLDRMDAALRDEMEAPSELLPWLEHVTPQFNWRWPYLVHIQEQLARIDRGEINKLMLFLPPRHGKTSLATLHYPTFCMERNPALRVVIAAYNQSLANRFSKRVRRLSKGRIQLARGAQGVEDWETAAGGGLRAVGVGAGITGHGGDLVIIDDPVKSREEAESQAYRDRVWEWYTDDLYTRLEPGAAVILIMTRWHQDDLAGRILASEDGPNWAVVNLPANAEEDDALGRGQVTCPRCDGEPREDGEACTVCEGLGTVGEALCPERYPVEKLSEIRTILGRSFLALYQQRPRPREGDLFKWDWFRQVMDAPTEAERVRYWDTAGSEGRGDYTAGVLMSRTDDGIITVEDVVRGQWSPGRRDEQIRATADQDAANHGKTGFTIWLEHEAGVAGAERTRATQTRLAGYRVKAERVTGSKTLRAEPFAAQAEAGNVRVLKRAWTTAYLNELCDFPSGAHDDQVDASSGAFNKVVERRTGTLETFEWRIV